MSGGQLTRQRNRLVAGFYLVVAVSAFSQSLWPRNGLFLWGLVLACASTATLACIEDARSRGRPILTSVHFLIFLTWPMAVPIYLVQSRKWRGAVLSIGHALAFGGVCILFCFVPEHVGRQWANEGNLALEERDYDRATTLLRRAVWLRRQDADVWASLGAALEGNDQTRDAVAAYERALALAPDWTYCRTSLFVCKWHLAYDAQVRGDSANAVALYRQALSLNDAKAEVWYSLAAACADSGDVTAGIKAMEKACALEPQNEDYRRSLAALRGRKP